MKLTVDQLYDKLLNEDKILTQKGQITFKLGKVDIIVKQRDVVGNIMQEWISGWMDYNNVDFALNQNTQMPPDFYLDPDDLKHNLLEIKAFNYQAGPGFDIADFKMYEQEIVSKPWMLDVTYLIFGYEMSEDGVVTIKKMWKQKVWEICRPMISGKGSAKVPWPLNLQIKQGVVHKIRPAKWFSPSRAFRTFENVEDFLSAVEETIYQNPDTRPEGSGWKHQMTENYQKFYGRQISIPRWDEIADKYIVKR
jgi:hypothetical protein